MKKVITNNACETIMIDGVKKDALIAANTTVDISITSMGATISLASKNSTKRAMTAMVATPCNIPALLLIDIPLMMSQMAYPSVIDGKMRCMEVNGPEQFVMEFNGSSMEDDGDIY